MLLSNEELAASFRVLALEDGRMNLLRSICCFFGGRCAVEEPKPTKETRRGEPPVPEGDLGQTEAELEKTGKEQMSHMEAGGASKATH
jgi:hypothetical protein